MNKKVRNRCENHYATDRSWDRYFYKYTKYNIDYYGCISCNEMWNRRIAGWKKVVENNERQKREAFERWELRLLEKYKDRDPELQLWDYVVKRELLKGMKKKHLVEFPKEMLRLKRASMRLERLIKHKKELVVTEMEKIFEEKHRQAASERAEYLRLNPQLDCKKHGRQFKCDLIRAGVNRDGTIRYRCKKCMSQIHKKYYEDNKDFVNQQNSKQKLKKRMEENVSNQEHAGTEN